MKPIYSTLLLVGLFACQTTEEIQERGKEQFNEVPPLIASTKPCATLYKSIMDMFYEHQNNQAEYPMLFSENTQKNIVLTHKAKVFVSFISEGAGFENSLGYYTYKASEGVGSKENLTLNIIFPHISETVLTKGDMVQLGTEEFEAGTVIGFFLIIRGWENGYVNFKKNIHYTNYQFNINQFQQHIVFKEGTCGDVVMAFEDKPLADGSDYDYNDVIFTVSDNNQQLETVNFDLTNMVLFEPTTTP